MKKRNVKSGFTLLEVLIAMLLLILVMIGFLKGVMDLQLFLKANNINMRAKELAESINLKLLTKPYEDVKNCFTSSVEKGYLLSQGSAGNETFSFSFDNDTFYESAPYYPGNCNPCSNDFACLYCYVGEKLIPSSSNSCNSGYPITVKYHGAVVLDSFTDKEVGFAVGVLIQYQEPKTKREKTIKLLVFKKKTM